MKRLASVLMAVVASAALAQAPAVLRPPKSDTPPEIPPTQAQTFLGGIYSATVDGGSARLCITPDGQEWECMLTAGDTAAAYATTGAIDAGLAAVNARIDSVADAGSTALASAVSAFDAGIVGLAARVSAVETQAASTSASLGAVTGRVTSLESNAATNAALAAAVATLTARIASAETLAGAGKTLCNSVNVVGINIPLLGISPPTNVAIPGAQALRPCFVAPASNLPLAAHPECSSSDGAASIVFRAAGLLGALSIPTGTYAACVVNP